MQVKIKSDEISPCLCGFKPEHVTLGYGRTPYDIFCPQCKKQASIAKCQCTGAMENIIDYWNVKISKMSNEDIKEEIKEFNSIRKLKDPYDEYNEYQYFWYKDLGEKLSIR